MFPLPNFKIGIWKVIGEARHLNQGLGLNSFLKT